MSEDFDNFEREEMWRAKKITEAFAGALRSRRPEIVKAGWERMLRTSNFPVYTGRVLEHGFNPRNWFTTAAESARYLAELVYGRLVGAKGAKPASEAVAVAQTLNWGEAVKLLDPLTIEVLGLLWYADGMIFSSDGVEHPEACSHVWAAVWKLIEDETRKSKTDIEAHIQECVRRLESIEWVVWEEMIQVPVMV